MKVLITGAGGFVGHHLVEYFLKTTDWEIVATDSFRHGGLSPRLKHILEINSKHQNRVTVLTHDLFTPIDGVTRNKMGDINIIVNSASIASVDESIADPRYVIQNNIQLQINVLEYARTLKNLQLFVQISTDEVFGETKKEVGFSENTVFTPTNPYSASKASQELICSAYWNTYDLPIIITNTMNMFGIRQSTRAFIPKTIEFLLNNKKVPVYSKIVDGKLIPCSRFYLNIENQSNAIKFLINKLINTPITKISGIQEIYKFNITDGNEYFNDEIVNIIAKELGIKNQDILEYVSAVDFRPGHDDRYNLNGSKLYSLGWRPPITFEEGISHVVKWTLNNKEWLLDIY